MRDNSLCLSKAIELLFMYKGALYRPHFTESNFHNSVIIVCHLIVLLEQSEVAVIKTMFEGDDIVFLLTKTH